MIVLVGRALSLAKRLRAKRQAAALSRQFVDRLVGSFDLGLILVLPRLQGGHGGP